MGFATLASPRFFGLECKFSILGSFDDSASEDPDVELEDSDGEE